MPDNELNLDIDDTGARAKIAGLKAELAQLLETIKEIKSALGDTTGQQRTMLQGALTGYMGRVASIQSSLGTAQASANVGGVGAAQIAANLITGGVPTSAPAVPAGMQAQIAGGVQPMNPGTTQGQFGASGYIGYPSGVVVGGGRGGALLPPGGGGGGGTGGGAPVPYGGGALVPSSQGPQPGSPLYYDLRSQNAFGGGGNAFPYPYNFQPSLNPRVAYAAAYGAARVAGSSIDFATNMQMRGGDDPMGRASLVGQGVSTAIGIAAGVATGNPLIGAGAYALSTAVIDPIARRLALPEAQRQAGSNALNPLFGALYGPASSIESARFTQGTPYVDPRNPLARGTIPSRLEQIQIQANQANAFRPEYTMSVGDVAATFGGVSSTLFNYGRDPFAPGDRSNTVYRPFQDYARQLNERAGEQLRGGQLNAGLAGVAAGAAAFSVRARVQTDETIAETYTRRLGIMFGNQAPDIAKRIAPAFDPMLGGNAADILGAIGPENTLSFLRVTDPNMASQIDPALLSHVSGLSRQNARSIALGGLRPTQSAAAQQFGFAAEMANLRQLPGGENSLAYAQAYSGYRQQRFAAFGQQTLAGFGMRDLALQGEQQRQNYMPFAPGNIFATSLGIIANNRGQIGRIGGMLQNTDLSEQERYSLESQRQGLLTENARNVGLLSEGFENRLPALAAGRPSFYGRYNSLQGAAINLGNINSPIRAYGAMGGAQAGMQDAFVRGLAGGDTAGAMTPYSRTSAMNDQAVLGVLTQILGTLQRNNGASAAGGNRPSDAYGIAAGALDSKDLGQEQIYNSR